MENQNSYQISEASREMFRNAATWMRIFAIILFIVIGLMAIFAIIISADRNGEILNAMTKTAPVEVARFFQDAMGVILVGLIVFVLLFGYATSRLLAAANSFTAISYSPNKEQLIKAFKNLKMYWMFYSITMITITVLAIVVAVKMISAISAAQG